MAPESIGDATARALPSMAGDDGHRPARHPRLLPARPDLAATSLRGRVEAERFVEGTPQRVTVGVLDLKREPRPDASLDTQLLYGETVQVYEDVEGWAWVQADHDDYVGYVASHGLEDTLVAPSHKVIVARTFVYPAADMKQAVSSALPLAAHVSVEEDRGPFVRLSTGGFVWRAHLAPLVGASVLDVVATAEQLLGVPYLWGGRSPLGLDCSGLVQLSHAMAGVAMPRDASMQEQSGHALSVDAALSALERGDLIFWPGHVGLMADAETLIHASGHQMLVCAEPLRVVRARLADGDPPKAISSIVRRL